ncbi:MULTISPECIES: signal recognition particle-docking protein FtsY [unclassified Pseudoalteromonas]|uniref:signal recognition particle-docking protein FtsY n=1 Tax=unclassified Pseudoalteromonas TaxID=194690 RepID=UPI0023583296|nr:MULTISPECIES: signal recognition particle-docking protein FtsY [unclassified Pseudoalteromonas]MDC9564994.1 signal recognition particle-docking protein FtsY [Pseudoalteromonas sp. GAB2316C]MDC9569358.1 signal recognition particle-docking protein FtsY [Pseudoalteromonas sp. GABNB9D]MDC9573406.1 signal recognition particle-docking protein FtsY [Pseudoalteromonas sp. GABNS16A]MDC9577799.1 signal recognition particle-docking protein FtsY [Pseudoalteromonas sp. GABNS16E]MDC9585452.1 signal recog
MAKKSKFMSWLGFGKSDKKQAEADKQQALAQQQEAERLAAEKAEAEREEQARIAAEKAQAERLAIEKANAELLAKEQAEAQAQQQAQAARLAEQEAQMRLEQERMAAQRAEQQRLDTEREQAEQDEKLAIEKANAELLAKEQAEAQVQQQAQAARLTEQEAQMRLEQERVAAEKAEAERLEQERIAQEQAEADRLEQERIAAEQAEAERVEQERIAAEQAEAERLEQQRIAAEQAEAERVEQQRIAAEQAEAERVEQERIAAEQAEAERLEQQRIAAEQAEAERLEQERIAQEQAEAERAEQERIAAEAEADRLEQERITAELAKEEAKLAEKPKKEGFFSRLKKGLLKTRVNIGSGFASIFSGKKIDDDLFEDLETQLLTADLGVDTTMKLIDSLTDAADRKQLKDGDALYELMKQEMAAMLKTAEQPLEVRADKKPFVILMVGVNGVGKTTTIGKLAKQFQNEGKSVMLAAGDTFRAAAVEQLQVWGERNSIPVIAQHTGADSASVVFDAFQAAKARNVDVLIADTAGRLQNKDNLMQELEKIARVMKKIDPDAPHEVMLTIDAGTGQNAISQVNLFNQCVGLTGITLSKLDGTAKGGVIFAVADKFNIPIRYIGVGEGIDDLRAFKSDDFIDALFSQDEDDA